MSGTGKIRLEPDTDEVSDSGYRSCFSYNDKQAVLDYYYVNLEDYGVKAGVTTGRRSGIFRFTYPRTDSVFVLIDPNRMLWQKYAWLNIRVEDDRTITGYKLTKGWRSEGHIYFRAELSYPFRRFMVCRDKKPVIYNTSCFRSNHEVWGPNILFTAIHSTQGDTVVTVKASTSSTSTNGAKLNMQELRGHTSGNLKQLAE